MIWHVIRLRPFIQETSIELVIIDDDGIVQSICEQPVFGTIKDLAILRWDGRFHAQSEQVLPSPFFPFSIC